MLGDESYSVNDENMKEGNTYQVKTLIKFTIVNILFIDKAHFSVSWKLSQNLYTTCVSLHI